MLSSILLPSALCVLSVIFTPAWAQFQWQFNNSVASTSLATCVSLPITVKPFNIALSNSSGVPPYSMMAFAIGGTPTTTLIGTDASSLSWTVTQPVGTRLMLSLVDGASSEGGIPADIYEVAAGQTTNCVIPPSTSPNFTITSNITGSLATCQHWGLTIIGGVAPYKITLASTGARVVTNVTLPSSDNHYTYVNRAAPGAQLLAAASDSTGRWATGTPMLATQGSSNTDCNGLSSSSDHSTSTTPQSTTSLSQFSTGTPQKTGLATANKNKTPLIVGVTVPLAVILIVGGSLLALLYLRKRRTRQAEKEDPLTPRQFRIEEESQRQVLNHMSDAETPPASGKGLAALVTSRHAHSPATTSNVIPSGITTASSIPSTTAVSSSSPRPSQTMQMQKPDAAAEDIGPGEGETVFQHRDAAVVGEIPPPYADSQSRPDDQIHEASNPHWPDGI